MTRLTLRGRAARASLVMAVPLLLSACVSFGSEPPESLLTLSSDLRAPVGQTNAMSGETALVVFEPEVPAQIDVLRVPVRVSDTSLAYLQDAVWVEKPARLFRRLMAETIRAQSGRSVIDGDTVGVVAGTQLRGTLREFGYDAGRSAVVLQYDAVLRTGEDTIATRRFEASVDGIPPEANAVGSAMNNAANDLAKQVSAWVQENS